MRNYLRELTLLIEAHELPEPKAEYHFKPPGQRNPYRFDLAWPEATPPLALEYDGVVGGSRGYANTSHGSLAGIMRDQRKSNEAQLAGWTVLRVNAKTVDNGQALQWIKRALGYPVDSDEGSEG